MIIKKKYSVQAKDLYNDPKFFGADGTTPLINFNYTIYPIEVATPTDLANTINGTSISTSRNAPLSGRFEDSTGNAVSGSYARSVSVSLNYDTAYKSQISGAANPYSFDKGSDAVIEPTSTSGNMSVLPTYSTVENAKSDNTGFAFSFNMEGIGSITAESTRLEYWSNDGSAEAENIWWKWAKYSDGRSYKSTLYYTQTGDLAGLMGMLTDSGTKPGVLNSGEGGCSATGGNATLYFSLKSGGSSIGSLNISLSVTNTDTEQTVLDKIKNAFNSSTVLDLYSTDAEEKSTGAYTYPGSARTNEIKIPVYGATNTLQIQAGSEAGQYIKIDYDALNIHTLKMQDTNVRTSEAASDAIDEVKYAMQVVNEQRADFGAFQNRLEHTYKNLDNVVENTTAAESQIRDTDMAKAMVQQSLFNILEQAGASMLSQANQTPQGVLSLLG